MRIKTNRKNSLSLIFFSLCLVLVFGLIFAFIGSSNKGETETAEQTTLITFNVDDTEYQTPKNWAWSQYVNSVYSNDFAIDEDDYVCSQNGIVAYNNIKVLKTDKIIASANYTIIPVLSFSIDNTNCQFESNMTWSDWVSSKYNNDVTIIDNFVYTQNGVITYNNSNVLKTDLIVENAEYDIVSTISFGLAVPTTDSENGVDGVIMPCRAESGMTWAQWLASDYNYCNVANVNGYACIDNCFIHTNGYTSFINTTDLIVNGQTYSGVSEIISFSIDNTSYNAVNNMTWAIWLNSPYNTNNYTAFGNYISYNNSLVVNNGYVEKTDIIIANTSYTLENTISFYIGNTSYQATGLVVQTTWQSWVNSAYNTDNYTIVGDYIYSAQNGVVTYNDNNVLKTDYIVANRNYTLTQTITFSDDFGYSYHAINGMTWSQFVNSDFNTKPFVVNGDTIKNSSNGSSVIFNDTGSIAPTDVIIANYSYSTGVPVGNGLATDKISVGAQSYKVRRGATWSQWLENGYGVVTSDFTIDSNNYIQSQNGFVQYNNNNVVKTDTLVRGATYSILYDSYTITYKDGGNTTFSGTHQNGYPTTHTYGTATTLKTATKNGYTFGGWYTDSACTNATNGTLGATAYTSNITLYAKWISSVQTFTFTISYPSYTAESGMTWAQWVASAYNTDGCYISGQYVLSSNGQCAVALNNTFVDKDDVILDTTYSYDSYTPPVQTIAFTIDGTSYTAESGMTWADWVNSAYNVDEYKLEDEDSSSSFVLNAVATYSIKNVYANDLIIENNYTLMRYSG